MFIIKATYWDKGYPKGSQPHLVEFKGETLSEAVSKWKDARYNLNLVKYEQMHTYDIIDTKEA